MILGVLVRREDLRIFGPEDWPFMRRVLVAASLMGAAVFTWSVAFERGFDVGAEPARMLETGGGLALGILVYAVALQLQGIRAVPDAVRRLARTASGWRRG